MKAVALETASSKDSISNKTNFCSCAEHLGKLFSHFSLFIVADEQQSYNLLLTKLIAAYHDILNFLKRFSQSVIMLLLVHIKSLFKKVFKRIV